MEPLLLTTTEMPVGYVTKGPQLTPPSGTPEFFGALPPDVPVVYETFSMDSNQGPADIALTQDSITEAVAKATSSDAAIALLQKVDAAATACGGNGTSIAVPGSVSNLVASQQDGATASQSFATAEVFAVTGSYILETRWFNTNMANPTAPMPPAAAVAPTAQTIGTVVDAALRRIPTSQ